MQFVEILHSIEIPESGNYDILIILLCTMVLLRNEIILATETSLIARSEKFQV